MKNLEQRFNEIFDKALEGYKVLPNIDKERYTPIQGLEGPFQTMSGKPIYYDPKEGAYYDRDTDMYLTYDEFKALDEGAPQSSPRPKPRPKRIPRPKPRPTINIGSNPETGSTRGIDPRDNYSPEDLKRLLMQSATVRRDGKTLSKSEIAKLQRQGVLMKEGEEKPYICVHAKKGKHECRAESSYAAAKKAAEHWGLKSTSGIDAHLAVDEGDGRKKGIHPKGHPMRKKQQAAIHAGESKLQDMRKALELSENTDANTVVAHYTRATLDQTHNTWNKVCEQIDHIRSFVKEDVDVSNVRLQIRKMHEQEGLDHKMLVKENVNKLRDIVKNKSAMSIKFADGSMKVDMTTANIFLQVFDKVKEETQAKIIDRIQTKTGFLSVLDKMYSMIG